MDVDEDDDFYAPEEPAHGTTQPASTKEQQQPTEHKVEQEDGDLEEGEQEDEGSEGSDSVWVQNASSYPLANDLDRTSTSSQRGKMAQQLLLHHRELPTPLPKFATLTHLQPVSV